MKRPSLLRVLSPLLLLACGEPTVPRRLTPPAAPHRTVSDAVHSSGKHHFYFLPPIVASPTTTGTFDPAVAPRVEICEYVAACVGAPIAVFNMATDPTSDGIRVS